MTELSDIAAKLGMRISAAPTPKPAEEPKPVVSKAPRPGDITVMVGQDGVRTQMMLDARSAMIRRASGDGDADPSHVLLTGPRGLGKTTLAKLTAGITGGRLVETTASAVNDPRVLARKLAELGDNDVLFIDEIHGLKREVQESVLYNAMEDRVIHVKSGDGVDATTVSVALKRFVLIGATTDEGLLEAPFVDRFPLKCSLSYYTDDELCQIVVGAAESMRIKIDGDAAQVLASRSKGTPRIALNLLTHVWSYVVAMNDGTDVPVTPLDVDTALSTVHKIDGLGLDVKDRAVLLALCARRNQGRPMGIENLVACTGIESATVKYEIEPLLLRFGLMVRTSRGRRATKAGYRHVGVTPPVDAGVDVD